MTTSLIFIKSRYVFFVVNTRQYWELKWESKLGGIRRKSRAVTA